MQAPTPLPGLPIGRGEVWRRGSARALLLVMATAALLPTGGLVALATGLVAPDAYVACALLPGVALAAAATAYAAVRERHLLARAAVGLLAGWMGVLAYDGLVELLRLATPGAGPALAWAAVHLPDGPAPLSVTAPTYAFHWLVTGALWGMAFAVVAGKAHWGWGVAYGAALGLLVLGAAALLPAGATIVAGLDAPRAALVAAGHVLFGAVAGVVNMALQPPAPDNAKIVFLRDYVAARERVRR